MPEISQPAGKLLAAVAVRNLQSFHYIGLFGLCGQRRTRDASHWFLYGKQSRRVGGLNVDTQHALVSDSLKDFTSTETVCFLDSDSGAHNFWVVDDDGTQGRLGEVLQLRSTVTALAVGGQYIGPGRCRSSAGYDGIYLYALCHQRSGWSASRCQKLVDGSHSGVVECRPEYQGYGEFDGQSAMVNFGDCFVLFTRANACADVVYRCVQVATSKDLGNFGP